LFSGCYNLIMPERMTRLILAAVTVGCACTVCFAQDQPLSLEPIVVARSNTRFLKAYSLSYDESSGISEGSPFKSLSQTPLDLQSRNLFGDIQTDMSLRGSGSQGVLVAIANQRINDPQTSHYNCDIPLTAADIQRIEIIPGAASSVFGPDAVGGVVNIIPKRPIAKKTVIETKAGSHGTFYDLFSYSDKAGDLGLRFSQENHISGGFREDTDFRKSTTAVSSSFDAPDLQADINLGYQDKEYGAYDFYTPGKGYPSQEHTRTYLLDSRLGWQKGELKIKPGFLWRRHYDKFILDKTGYKSKSINHHRSDIYTPFVYLQRESELLGASGLGLECGQERMRSGSLGDHQRGHKSAYIEDEKELNDLWAIGGSARLDDYDGFGQAYTGSLNSRYRLSGKESVSLAVSRNIRVPSFTELYYSDPTTIGYSGLKEERSINYQVGYDRKIKKGSWGTVFFIRKEDNTIDWVKSIPDQEKWQAGNIPGVDVSGIESYFKRDINAAISLDSNYTYINKPADKHGYLYKYGRNYTRHLANMLFSFKFPFADSFLGVTYKKKPGRDGWTIVNTGISRQVNKNIKVYLKAENLFNSEYQEIEGIPQPGRWVEAGMRLEW